MVSQLDLQTLDSEFDPHWVPHISGLVLHLNLMNNYYKLKI